VARSYSQSKLISATDLSWCSPQTTTYEQSNPVQKGQARHSWNF
jgi:hypothetical protein